MNVNGAFNGVCSYQGRHQGGAGGGRTPPLNSGRKEKEEEKRERGKRKRKRRKEKGQFLVKFIAVIEKKSALRGKFRPKFSIMVKNSVNFRKKIQPQ